MNREGPDSEEYIEEESEYEADDISTRTHLQVHTSENRSSLQQAREKVYTYTEVRDVIFQKVKNPKDTRRQFN